jgi:hypothetical protein
MDKSEPGTKNVSGDRILEILLTSIILGIFCGGMGYMMFEDHKGLDVSARCEMSCLVNFRMRVVDGSCYCVSRAGGNWYKVKLR